MKKGMKKLLEWVDGIAQAAQTETNPHRKAILTNYLQHCCLEYHGRWEEFLGPDMAVEHPVYTIKLQAKTGTSDIVVCDGYDAVLAFYMSLNENAVITNEDERLAVNDWGFASYMTIVQWTRGEHLSDLIPVTDHDPEGYYRVSRPVAMFWNYSPDAKLIGEEVYEVAPTLVEQVSEAEYLTEDEVRAAVSKYLPAAKLRVR